MHKLIGVCLGIGGTMLLMQTFTCWRDTPSAPILLFLLTTVFVLGGGLLGAHISDFLEENDTTTTRS